MLVFPLVLPQKFAEYLKNSDKRDVVPFFILKIFQFYDRKTIFFIKWFFLSYCWYYWYSIKPLARVLLQINYYLFLCKYKVYNCVLTHINHVSTVPNKHLFSLTAVLTAGTLSKSQRSLRALKYVLTGRPLITFSASPFFAPIVDLMCSTVSAFRTSNQTKNKRNQSVQVCFLLTH